MKTAKLILIIITVLIIAACSSTKKSSTTSASTITPTSSTSDLIPPKSAGIPVPGNEELSAIQLKYTDVTLDKLKEGHAIYAQGACVNCHSAQNIYKYTESQWLEIIDDMAIRARISDTDKDAVYKYVLATKATQLK